MDMESLTDILHRGNHSLVVANGAVRTFDGRGVSDLYRLLVTAPAFLRGAAVADKVIGKGAAALMVLGCVSEIYTDIISTPALALFRENDMSVSFSQEVPHIINRTGTGICPVETLCGGCRTAAECLPFIRDFIDRQPEFG